MEIQAVNLQVHDITAGSVLVTFRVHGSRKLNLKDIHTAVDDKMKEQFSIEDLYIVEESIPKGECHTLKY